MGYLLKRFQTLGGFANLFYFHHSSLIDYRYYLIFIIILEDYFKELLIAAF